MEDYRDYGLKRSSDLVLAILPLWTRPGGDPGLIPRRGRVPRSKVARGGSLVTIAQGAIALVTLRGLCCLVDRSDGHVLIEVRPDRPAAICGLGRPGAFDGLDARLLAITDAL